MNEPSLFYEQHLPAVFAGAQWITNHIRQCGEPAAPLFRKSFDLASVPDQADCFICGLGIYELRINGVKAGDRVLEPPPSRYDKRTYYTAYNIAPLLKTGFNTIEVQLGNGHYNVVEPDVWGSTTQNWRTDPRFLLKLDLPGLPAIVSDQSWLTARGPVTFNSLRNGEFHDARLELAPWHSAESIDRQLWHRVYLTASPGGLIEEGQYTPCRVIGEIPPVSSWKNADGSLCFDFGANITGCAGIEVQGESGSTVTMRYAELLDDSGTPDQSNINWYVKGGEFQTDRYTLAGGSCAETWAARFVYHGFRYVKCELSGNVELKSIKAKIIYTDFAIVGTMHTSDHEFNTLLSCALRSYTGNYVGLPTDCPHREKLGWTGDAALACELGLWHFDAANSYMQWLQAMADCQRDSGQVPGIVPIGRHWEFGPVWDCALIEIPYQIYLFTGNCKLIMKLYPAMRNLMRYFHSLTHNGILEFGPGDWCHHDRARAIGSDVDGTAFYYRALCMMAQFAALLGKDDDLTAFTDVAAMIKHAFRDRFEHADHTYANGEPTAAALAIAFGLSGNPQKSADKLATMLRQNRCHADFGIVGAKYVPRALSEYGHIDVALELFTQKEFPGWGYWLTQGATTLWETWDGSQSQNHIMFGDVGAWCWRYLGGFKLDFASPGFRSMVVAPQMPTRLHSAQFTRETPCGSMEAAWSKNDAGAFTFALTLPSEAKATVILPDGSSHHVSGKFSYCGKLRKTRERVESNTLVFN